MLSPGWTSYPNRLHFVTNDVTALVAGRVNAIGAILGDGWFRGYLGWDGKRAIYGDQLGLLAQLEITYTDGSRHTIVTDTTWQTSFGPIVSSDIYNGETYDGRATIDGWSSAEFDAMVWDAAENFAPNVGALVAPLAPPVRRTQELTAGPAPSIRRRLLRS